MFRFFLILWLFTTILSAQESLHKTARHFQQMIEKWHLHHGQIRSVHFQNKSKKSLSAKQDNTDSALVNGKYLAALSFQYAVEPNDKTLAMVKRTLQTFYTLTHISGTPGLVCREFYLGEAKKQEYHFKASEAAYKDFSFKGQGNRDQTTGVLWGLLCAHQLVNEPYCKELSRYLLSVIVNAVYQEPENWQDSWYYLSSWQIRQAGSDKTIRLSSNFKLLCLAIGHHIIKDPVYTEPYNDYFDSYFNIENPFESTYRVTEYYSNNLKLMRYLSVLFLENNPQKRQHIIDKVNSVFALTYDHQNSYFTYLTVLASDEKNIKYLDKKYRLIYRLFEAKESLKQFNEEYLWSSLPKVPKKEQQYPFYYYLMRYGKYLIKGSRPPRHLSQEVLAVSQRLPEAFLWHRNPYSLAGEQDYNRPLTRRTGVDFLIAYWLGRYCHLIGENE